MFVSPFTPENYIIGVLNSNNIIVVVRSNSIVRNKEVELIMHFKQNHPKVQTDTTCNTVLYQYLLLTVGLVYNQVTALNPVGYNQ